MGQGLSQDLRLSFHSEIMNILFLCNKSPYPAKEGGPMAMNMMIEGVIREGHRVKVLAINSNKYTVDPSVIPEEYKKKTGIEFVEFDLRVKPIQAFINLFTGRSYHVERFISQKFSLRLKEILQNEKFDIVQFEMLYMAPYLDTVRKYSNAKAIYRAHNIEHRIWQRIAENTTNPIKRSYLNHLVRTLRNYELNVICDFDGIAAITETDAQFFRDVAEGKKNVNANIEAIPFGIDLSKFPADITKPEFPSIFSIGSMDWNPNIEGISWFLENVWPEVHQQFPDLNYFLAGRNMPQWLRDKGYPNVAVVGEVDDSVIFMRSKSVLLVPLLSGSGIRIKIIEGMAAGKAIISTHIGAEGINCTDGKNIILADTPAEFFTAISRIYSDESFCKKLGENARKLIEQEYQQQDLVRKMIVFYEKAGT